MSKPSLLIPVENQVRELDAKVLLSCFGAERGFDAYVGWKGAIDNHINDFPSSVYFAKSLTERSVKIFKISRMLGHRIVAWDEEAIVHYPPEVYYTRRLSNEALGMTEQLLAWGEDNKTLLQGFPNFPGTPIKIVGNPRGDLLRPEFRPFFNNRVDEIKSKYGDFILFNTNFGSINGFYRQLNVCYPQDGAPEGLALGRSAIGFKRDFAVRLYKYRNQVLEKFKQLVPDIARAFPDRTIVLRPHPAENRDFWREHLKDFDNVHVDAEGNVVPWLLACSVLIHNGCTTAVEGYILKRPVIAYAPLAGGEDFAVDPPNSVSDIAVTAPEVIEKIGQVLDNKPITVNDTARDHILGQFISSLDGEFAVSKIINCVESQAPNGKAPLLKRAVGGAYARSRRFVKELKTTETTGRYSAGFKQQRFPDVTVQIIREKIHELSMLGGLQRTLDVEHVLPDVFRVRAL